MKYGKLVRKKTLKEEIDLDEKYRELLAYRKTVQELKKVSDKEKIEEWNQNHLYPAIEALKQKEEEFKKLLKEKNASGI